MLPMLRDLVHHKWHANAALLKAIRQHEKAAQDEELRKLLHHILLANRFWLLLSLGRQFDFEKERHVPDSLELLTTQYRETQAQELKWIGQMQDADLERRLETPFLPASTFSVAEGIMQNLSAQPRTSGPMRHQIAPARRHASGYRLHSLAQGTASSAGMVVTKARNWQIAGS